MVNSSFEYFPALPIHKSEDLVNWELVGHGLNREDQCSDPINLMDVQSNGGIFAPTIRYHNGKFHIVSTNVYYDEALKKSTATNFIITSTNPEGPWSDPIVIEGAPGIDPDIFFDDDGRVWYTGNHQPSNPSFPGETEIWMQELNPSSFQLVGKRYFIWRGACGGVWAEGPHLFKKNGTYYLLIAEGGTSFNHSIMIASSDHITGPYISNERNPIFSSRQLSYDNWVHSTGHGDLIELDDERWYIVMLGIRGDVNRKSNMGRETFIAPVSWEKQPNESTNEELWWPVIAPNTGRIVKDNKMIFENTSYYDADVFDENFNDRKLGLAWNFRRVPNKNMYSLTSRQGYLRVFTHPNNLENRKRANFMGIKQTQSDFNFSTQMEFSPSVGKEQAGVILIQKDNNFLYFNISHNEGQTALSLEYMNEVITNLKSENIDFKINTPIRFKVESNNKRYKFYYATEGEKFKLFVETSADLILSNGYTGSHIGFYLTTNQENSQGHADFDWVKYKALKK
jgi:alpha-N-arabinofuranosidase